MADRKSYPLWEAVQFALEHARASYKRRNGHLWTDGDAWMSGIRETKVTVQLQPCMTQLLTFTFTHKVISRSYIYYYSLRRQVDDTYSIYDVNAGRQL